MLLLALLVIFYSRLPCLLVYVLLFVGGGNLGRNVSCADALSSLFFLFLSPPAGVFLFGVFYTCILICGDNIIMRYMPGTACLGSFTRCSCEHALIISLSCTMRGFLACPQERR